MTLSKLRQHKLYWQEIEKCATVLAEKYQDEFGRPKNIVGVRRGGVFGAELIAYMFGLTNTVHTISCKRVQMSSVGYYTEICDKSKQLLVTLDRPDTFIVDDIFDTGATRAAICEHSKHTQLGFLVSKSPEILLYGRLVVRNRWIVFPWELLEEFGPKNRLASSAVPEDEGSRSSDEPLPMSVSGSVSLSIQNSKMGLSNFFGGKKDG
jgi:hypoxanthine phosphoribosyltransferase